MKTDYNLEIIDLLQKTFTPATPTTENAIFKTLQEIHYAVISVLPSKWVYEEDVYEILQQLNFKTFPLNADDKIIFYYYLPLVN